jgi:glycosyltransferase involved in cell wall biosynthesis
MVMASVSRNSGGLFPVVRRLTQELAAGPSTEVTVIGLVDEHTAEDAPLWAPLRPELCQRQGPAVLGYSPDYRRRLSRDAIDIVHQHGIWTLLGREVTRFAVPHWTPYIVSLHGMVEPWAFRNGKWKKRLAWWAYQRANLERASALSVNSEREAEFLRELGIRSPIAVVPNGVDSIQANSASPAFGDPRPRGQKTLLFLGRLHPKKGLKQLLLGFSQATLREPQLAESWTLVISGWDEGGHERELRALREELRLGERVCLTGPIFGAVKDATLCHADAFILPSFGEGMPIAALEALSAGIPVLLSPECNLGEVFTEGAGIRVEPSPEGVADGLVALFRLSPSERADMGERARRLSGRFSWNRIAADVRRLYLWCLGGERPGDLLR